MTWYAIKYVIRNLYIMIGLSFGLSWNLALYIADVWIHSFLPEGILFLFFPVKSKKNWMSRNTLSIAMSAVGSIKC